MKKNKPIKIVIYRFTGKQGFFTIPKNWCAECDLLISLIKRSITESSLENSVELIIRPWFIWSGWALIRYFTWHAPILIINKKVISAGIVPKKEDVIHAIKSVL